MTAAIQAAGADDSVVSLLITGQRDVFASGNDLQDFMNRPPSDNAAPVIRFMHALLDFEKPVIAAVTGPAIGIGTTMLLHCDLVYVSTDAKLAMPFVSLGLVPEFASSFVLPRLMGHPVAAEKLLLGEPFTGTQAVALGIATAALPAAEVLAHAQLVAERFNHLPAGAVRDTKRLLRAETKQALRNAIDAENTIFAQRLESPEAKEAFAAFFQKRKPDFSKR
jgi:enoyl-CoA hydratase/carnithine racemase